MVSEAPSRAPMFEAGGEGTAEKGPGEGGLFLSESPGKVLFGAACPACADCGSAEQGCHLLLHRGLQGEGSPAVPPKQLLWVTVPPVLLISAPPSATRKQAPLCFVEPLWKRTAYS